MLTQTSGYKRYGRGARASDAVVRPFVCETCRVRAQCGYEVVGDLGDHLRELERVSIITRWSHHTDASVNGVATSRRTLMRLDDALPVGCPRAAPPHRRRWPLPSETVTLRWHQLEIMRSGGKGEGGMRSLGGLKALRTAMFNYHREELVDNPSAVATRDTKLAIVPGSAPSDGVGTELFIKGLEATMGSKSTQADALPPSVARALESAFLDVRGACRSVWAKYEATARRFGVVVGYTLWLRGDEPWKLRFSLFKVQPFLREACPRCGHTHANVLCRERVKTDNRGFDMVMATPLSGAGLNTLGAVEDMLFWRGEVQKVLDARGVKSDYLFVQTNGRAWTNSLFWQKGCIPELRRLQAQRHPGLHGIDLDDSRRAGIRMLRRGGETFVMHTDVRPDYINMVGRWREADTKDPTVLRQRYFGGVPCEVGWQVTAAAPPRSSIGFAAWHSFE